jgi:hypothetical protein
VRAAQREGSSKELHNCVEVSTQSLSPSAKWARPLASSSALRTAGYDDEPPSSLAIESDPLGVQEILFSTPISGNTSFNLVFTPWLSTEVRGSAKANGSERQSPSASRDACALYGISIKRQK